MRKDNIHEIKTHMTRFTRKGLTFPQFLCLKIQQRCSIEIDWIRPLELYFVDKSNIWTAILCGNQMLPVLRTISCLFNIIYHNWKQVKLFPKFAYPIVHNYMFTQTLKRIVFWIFSLFFNFVLKYAFYCNIHEYLLFQRWL